VTIIGVSGEAVAEYAAKVDDLAPTRHTMRVGCIDDTFGYIPTADMIREGGYESRGFCSYFNVGSVNNDVESHTLSAFGELLRD
jgi:hypothetical protein